MEVTIKKEEYRDCLKYIEKYWTKLTCYHPKDQFIHLGLPNKFIAPSIGIYKKDQFYRDSYFIIVGLVKCDRIDLAKGMVDNFFYLFEKFKKVRSLLLLSYSLSFVPLVPSFRKNPLPSLAKIRTLFRENSCVKFQLPQTSI